MSSVLFLAGIENLSMQSTPGRGDAVSNAFRITTDRSFVERLIPDSAQHSIGGIEIGSLTNGRPVAYTKVEDRLFKSESEAQRDLVNWLTLMTSFLQHIWFIKDNAVGLEFGYVIWPMRGHFVTTRNFLGQVFTDAAMTRKVQRLSVDEFRMTRERFQKRVVGPALAGAKKERPTRLDRAIYFVQAARVAPHVPVKISNYCTALEALFSNDAAELTHKLSERVSWFIGDDGTARIDVFQRIKKAYGIRSKVVHGVADWGKDALLATSTSEFLDEILRKAFDRISAKREIEELFTADSELGKRKHEEFMLNLVLGIGSLGNGVPA